jgi:copper/silver efflux system protein
MTAAVVAWSARHHRAVLLVGSLLAMAGAFAWRGLHRDVLPDLSDPQIVLVADWMGHPAGEVATSVAQPLTGALQAVPGVTAVRAASMSGMAYLDVTFSSVSRLPAGRAAIVEQVARFSDRLPATARVRVGPQASSTGWVYQYALVDPARHESPLALRRFQDEVLGPALASIAGVAEVAAVGGGGERVVVRPRLDELRRRQLAFSDVVSAVRAAPATAGGRGRSAAIEALAAAPVGGDTSTGRCRLADVARVGLTSHPGNGFADLGGSLEAVGGVVIAERNADLPSLIREVRRVLAEKRAAHPGRLEIVPVHDRLALVEGVGRTLWRALVEEVAVAALVILVFLLHGKSALVPLLTLPLTLLLSFLGMRLLGLPATLMSLGGVAIALGMAVDADVVALEACHRRLEDPGDAPGRVRSALVGAAATFAPALQTSLLIAAVTFLPVLAWTGETGRLLRPLALGKTLVIVAAALVTFTVAPALRDRLLRGRVPAARDNRLVQALVRLYRPLVQFALHRPRLTLATATLAVASCLPILPRLGGEFLPRIDEGDLLFMPTTLAGVPPEEAMRALRAMDRALASFPEVATVFGKVGRADSATDPAPYSMAETILRLRPRTEWPATYHPRWYSSWAPPALREALGWFWPERRVATSAELLEKLDRAVRLPGWTPAWTAPLRARLDMMSTGVRTAVAVRIVAPSVERLGVLGAAIRREVLRVPGTRSALLESQGGETWPTFTPDPAALALHGVDPALARSTAELLLTGGQIGELDFGGGQRLAVAVADGAGGEGMRLPAERVRALTVRSRASATDPGEPVPLALLGEVSYLDGPAVVRSERGELVSYLHVDADLEAAGAGGGGLAAYVERLRQRLDALPGSPGPGSPGRHAGAASSERWELAGQYELLEAGRRRLGWIVPLVAISMLGLLWWQFRSLTEALIVLLSVPFALVGSFWTLFLLGYRLSPPVWVGLISVLGLAMQTGVVMVVYIDDAFHRRVRAGKLATRADIVAAHAEGTVERLRPKLMTVTTMAAGLLPLLWAEGSGAEILRRVAAPMIGGLVTSAFLTLEVLPVVYTIWRYRQLQSARRRGVPLADLIGTGIGRG